MNWMLISEYVVLIGIIATGLAGYVYAAPQTGVQLVIGILTSVAYVVWGCIHHALKKDLHIRIVIEYMLIGGIAVALLTTILTV